MTPTPVAEPPAITTLRRSAEAGPSWTLSQARAIVDGAGAAAPLTRVCADSGLDARQVKDVIAKLGTWLTHVLGGAKAVTVPAGRARPDTVPAEHELVVLGEGFERSSADRRDVSRSYAAVVCAHRRGELGDDALMRFLDRTLPERGRVLTYAGEIRTIKVWADLDRWDGLCALHPRDSARNAQLVAAFDLLERARVAANEALGRLCDPALTDRPAPEILDDIRTCRWLAEGELTRLERAARLAADRPTGRPALARELAFLRSRVAGAADEYYVAGIKEMNKVQVERVCAAAGLAVEADRHAAKEIRRRLIELGLRGDVDRLVPRAVRAAQAGALEAFWAAIDARLAGEADWAAILDDALA